MNAKGESIILEKREIETITPMPEVPSFTITNLYYIEGGNLTTKTEHLDIPYDINLPPKAMRFLACRISPIEQLIQEWNNPEIRSAEDFIKVGMHRTPSVDYFYVSQGAVTLYMGNGEEHAFKAGDAFTMRGADHAWINYGDCYCELVGMMLGVSE